MIADGIKEIEVRLGYPKARRIQAGQQLTFASDDDTVVRRSVDNLGTTNNVNTGKGYNELLASLRRLVDRMNRRDLVQLFGLTATTPFVSPWFVGLDPDEQERVAAAIVTPDRVDAQVLKHIESVLFNAVLSNDKLGPRAALHTVLAQQKILQDMIAECPDELRL